MRTPDLAIPKKVTLTTQKLNKEAWESIATELFGKLKRCWHPKLDDATIESAVLLAYAVVGAMIDNGEEVLNPKALMRKVAHRRLIKEYERSYRQKEVSSDEELIIPQLPNVLSPEKLIMQRSAADLLQEAIEALPDDLRVPLVRARIDEASYVQIAEELGIKEGTARTRVYRARKMLAATMEQHGYYYRVVG